MTAVVDVSCKCRVSYTFLDYGDLWVPIQKLPSLAYRRNEI